MGALTLPATQVKSLLADGDTRWINRGSYDLMGKAPAAKGSSVGIPVAASLYGSLPGQMKDPSSFARQIQKMLALREKTRIAEAALLSVPVVKNKSLLVLVHRLPEGGGIELTAINFGPGLVEETLTIPSIKGGELSELLEGKIDGKATENGTYNLKLAGYEGKVLLAGSGAARR